MKMKGRFESVTAEATTFFYKGVPVNIALINGVEYIGQQNVFHATSVDVSSTVTKYCRDTIKYINGRKSFPVKDFSKMNTTSLEFTEFMIWLFENNELPKSSGFKAITVAPNTRYVQVATIEVPDELVSYVEDLVETCTNLKKTHSIQRRRIDNLEKVAQECLNAIKKIEQLPKSKELCFFDVRHFSDVRWGILAKLNKSCPSREEKTSMWRDLGSDALTLSEELGVETRTVPLEEHVLKRYDYGSNTEKGSYREDVLEQLFHSKYGPPAKHKLKVV